MKKSKVLIALVLLCLLVAALLRRCDTTSTGIPQDSRKESSERVKLPTAPPTGATTPGIAPSPPTATPSATAIFSTPIVFYGNVQTQDGAPISEAQVTASVANKFGGESSKITTQSDSQGNFSLSSIGMTVSVRVSKDGYFSIPEKTANAPRSSGAFDYGADLGSGIHKPNRNAPVIFTLFKPPAIEPLTRIREKETVMPKNGEPVRVSLDAPAHVVELKCWTGDATTERDGRYDWKLEVSVVGGSLQRRGDSFDFTAPSDGYGQTDLIQMPRTLKRPDWQDDFEQSYWVRFNDGLFGNIKVRMIAGGAHYSIVSGYINPSPGSRNLAASPSKRK